MPYGAIPENIQIRGGRGWGYTFLKSPWNFSFFYLTSKISRQNKAQPLDIPQNCVRSLRNFKAKNKDPWKFHIIFSWSPFEIPLRFNSTCYFFDTPGNSISSKPPCLDFFWKSPIASYLTSGTFLLFINNYCWPDIIFYRQVGTVVGQINI